MNVRFLVVAFTLVPSLGLAGCITTDSAQFVWGDKISPGHCLQPGVVDISIAGFRPSPTATLLLKVRNLWEGDLSVEAFGLVSGDDRQPRDIEWRWERPGQSDSVRAQESATIILDVRGFMESPWRQMQVAYIYADQDGTPDDNPTNLRCSLRDDNAPWAFQTSPPEVPRMDLNLWKPGW